MPFRIARGALRMTASDVAYRAESTVAQLDQLAIKWILRAKVQLQFKDCRQCTVRRCEPASGKTRDWSDVCHAHQFPDCNRNIFRPVDRLFIVRARRRRSALSETVMRSRSCVNNAFNRHQNENAELIRVIKARFKVSSARAPCSFCFWMRRFVCSRSGLLELCASLKWRLTIDY